MRAYLIICCLYYLVPDSSCLYEDQVGKFEWRQQYVGKPIISHFDIAAPTKKVIVATEENVVAALSLKSGDIVWRNVLERGKDGLVTYMHVEDRVLTVSGSRTPVVRGWDRDTGHGLFEWTLGPVSSVNYAKYAVVKDWLVVFEFPHSEVFARWFHVKSGSLAGSKKSAFDIQDASSCVSQENIVACLESTGDIQAVVAGEPGQLQIIRKTIEDAKGAKLTKIDGPLPVLSLENSAKSFVIEIGPEIKVLPVPISSKAKVASTNADEQSLLIATELNNGVLSMRTYTLDGQEVVPLRGTTPYPANTAAPEYVTAVCQLRRDGATACRLLVSALDSTVTLIQHPGPVLWTRQEALASVISVEIVELPVSDTDAAIEKEFGSKNLGFMGMIARRLITQWLQLQTLLLTVLGLVSDSSRGPSGLVRDDFGLHKLIVAVTQPGKVFGIDNLSGEIVWQILADIQPLASAGSPTFAMFPMRSPIHVHYPAQLAVLGRTASGHGSLLVFNPISGELIEPIQQLNYKVRQVTALQATTEEHLRVILLLDYDNRIHVYPPEAKAVALQHAPNTYLYTVEPNSGQVDGFKLEVVDRDLVAMRTWQQKLGQDDSHVVAVVGKRDTERVHSQGRVLGDRNVLYKYVNPNLVAIFTQGYHPAHKTILNVFLLDAVSGMIVFSASHRRARDPIQAVHSENWLVYSYMSEKHRRTEVATLELYEGPFQSNETAFSSLAAPPLMPIVERQAYILPAHVTALKDTVTDKGITTKHIMVALSTGSIMELPWAYLDPRRTMMVTAEMREEGIVPYMPELPVPYEAIVNHNLSVAAVSGIHAAPSGLESTCLLFVYGLDLFYTRVAPSKTFDLLKEDFDYFLITAVLSGLILASVITRRMASRKALKQAWK